MTTPAPSERVAWLTAALRRGLDPLHLVVEDESHLHAGHAGAASGGGHFRALIVSAAFRGQNQVARQRAVYALLGDAMRIDHPRPGAAHAHAGGVGGRIGAGSAAGDRRRRRADTGTGRRLGRGQRRPPALPRLGRRRQTARPVPARRLGARPLVGFRRSRCSPNAFAASRSTCAGTARAAGPTTPTTAWRRTRPTSARSSTRSDSAAAASSVTRSAAGWRWSTPAPPAGPSARSRSSTAGRTSACAAPRMLEALRKLPHTRYASHDDAITRFRLLPAATRADGRGRRARRRHGVIREADGTYSHASTAARSPAPARRICRHICAAARCPILAVRAELSEIVDAAAFQSIAPRSTRAPSSRRSPTRITTSCSTSRPRSPTVHRRTSCGIELPAQRRGRARSAASAPASDVARPCSATCPAS